MNSEVIKEGINNYIQDNWTDCIHGIYENIVVEGDNSNYTAICTFYKDGHGGDTRGRIIITFKDVVDITDEVGDVNDDELWCEAYVDVASCRIETIDTVYTEDLYTFSQLSKDMYECLYRIYRDIPANENDKLSFYVRTYY